MNCFFLKTSYLKKLIIIIIFVMESKTIIKSIMQSEEESYLNRWKTDKLLSVWKTDILLTVDCIMEGNLIME